jgi:hypothetical protein
VGVGVGEGRGERRVGVGVGVPTPGGQSIMPEVGEDGTAHSRLGMRPAR